MFNNIFKQNKLFVKADETTGAVRDFLSSSLTGDLFRYIVFPGFCDVHVHFRQPGFSYKETILTGSKAAAKGGYTDVCTMPNLNPVPDSVEHLKEQTDIIKRDAVINVYPYGAITVGRMGLELADMENMRDAIAFSDDGSGVQSDEMMFTAMQKAKSLNKIIAAHCEDNSLLVKGGCIHDGKYARQNNLIGISSQSEYKQIERDLALVEKTGCSYHVCHISTKESVELIRQAKKKGLDVTCETAPHYLVLDDSDLLNEGRFKMNPPLRDKADRLALIEGLKDSTIDMIATDHAPHSAQEKSFGLEKSPFGIVGLETAFSVMYTHLVLKGVITLEKLIEVMAINPRKRFNIVNDNSFTVWDLEHKQKVDTSKFESMGKATPFENEILQGKCLLTVVNGEVAYKA